MGVALSDTLDGPWTRQTQSILGENCVPEQVATRMNGNPGEGDVSNPAVLILPNSSALLLYRYEAANHECIGVAFCPHFAGRCELLDLPAVGLFEDWNGEDPYVWLDAHKLMYSHAHVVYHTATSTKRILWAATLSCATLRAIGGTGTVPRTRPRTTGK